MKVDRLETHDRFEHFIQDQSLNIFQGAEDCLKKNELSLALQDKSPYIYIFAHPRTLGFDEKMGLWSSGQFKSFDEVPEKVMFWQPRLSKPEVQPNSYLFRAQSKSDLITICWLLPPKEMWDQYKRGNVTENEYVVWSIGQYKNNKLSLEESQNDDLPEEVAVRIWREVLNEKKQEIRMKKMFKPRISEESSEIYVPLI